MLLLLLTACLTPEPTYVSKGDLERAVGRGDMVTLCAGLKMKDDEVRRTAAEKLRDHSSSAASCLCDHLVRNGTWDPSVIAGLERAKRDDRVGCAAALLDDTALSDRPGLTHALLDIPAPAVKARLKAAATADPDPAVQAAAVPVFNDTKDHAELKVLMDGLGGANPAWSMAAAAALAGRPEAVEALRQTLTTHPDKGVRAAALTALHESHPEDWAQVLCHAMMEDTAGDVRAAAVRLTRSSRDPAVMACVRQRAFAPEADGVVRKALMETLKVAPAPEAATILCDVIPFWVRSYVTDTRVEPQSDLDVIYYQNSRDYLQSYPCVQKAVGGKGYSCWGRNYVGSHFVELGGKASVPSCDGSQRVGGGREVTFGE